MEKEYICKRKHVSKGPDGVTKCPFCGRPVKEYNGSGSGNSGWRNMIGRMWKYISDHKYPLLVVCVIIVIVVLLVLLSKQCDRQDYKPTESDEPTVEVSFDGENIQFKIDSKDKDMEYEIWVNDNFPLGTDYAYSTSKMKESDCCTFLLRHNGKELASVKWNILSSNIYEYGNGVRYCKESNVLPPEITCDFSEKNGMYRIEVTVVKGSADTYYIKSEAMVKPMKMPSGKFENLEEGTYMVWAGNRGVQCQPQEIICKKSDITKEKIQDILNRVSLGQMELSEVVDSLRVPLQNIKLDPIVNGNRNMNQMLTDIYGEKKKYACEEVFVDGEEIKVKLVKQ